MAAGEQSALVSLCAAALGTLPGFGLSISVWTPAGQAGAVYSSDAVAARLDELHFEFGSGPLVDAFTGGHPVLIDDLPGEARTGHRWPSAAAASIEAGAGAIFAFPMQIGAIRIGTVLLYRAAAGALSATELALALRLADSAAIVLLDEKARAGTANGLDTNGHETDRAGIDSGRTSPGLDGVILEDGLHRWVVYQASGMVMAQLGITIEQALARLRGHAYAEGRKLSEVAGEVVARTLRLERDND